MKRPQDKYMLMPNVLATIASNIYARDGRAFEECLDSAYELWVRACNYVEEIKAMDLNAIPHKKGQRV